MKPSSRMNAKFLRWLLALLALAAALVAGFMTYVAAQHNAQGEFNGPDGGLSMVILFKDMFLIWSLGVFALGAAVTIPIWYLTKRSR